jgi:hypothetical protein
MQYMCVTDNDCVNFYMIKFIITIGYNNNNGLLKGTNYLSIIFSIGYSLIIFKNPYKFYD